MTTNLDRYRADLDALVALGERMRANVQIRHAADTGKLSKEGREAAKQFTFEWEYQRWYTEASAVVRQLIPTRLQELNELYVGQSKRKDINASTYTIQDWLNGVRAGTRHYTDEKLFDDFAAVTMRFQTQLQILQAASRRFESTLLDIRQLVQADLLDSELDAARVLAKEGFFRAAGAVAGVVLEKHLLQVVTNHGTAVRKKNPTIGDFNEWLKAGGVVDTPTWHQIQRLAAIRNLCDHNREREPRSDEVEELISGVDKITKTLF